MSDITIRPFEAGDTEDVIEIWERCFPDDPPWNKPADVIRAKMTVQPELFFVAVCDNRVVGTVLAGFDGFRGWINKMATHPSSQRQGIASMLLQAAEQALAETGCRKVNLQVRADNAEVTRFYEHAGFAVEERISMGKTL